MDPDPYPLQPVILNGVAGFFIALLTLLTPVAIFTDELRTPTIRTTTANRVIETSAQGAITRGAS